MGFINPKDKQVREVDAGSMVIERLSKKWYI